VTKPKLTPSEKAVWARLEREAWKQMGLLFPRLAKLKRPKKKHKARKEWRRV